MTIDTTTTTLTSGDRYAEIHVDSRGDITVSLFRDAGQYLISETYAPTMEQARASVDAFLTGPDVR